MFIEITEYSNKTGQAYGKAIINTDDIMFVDNWDSELELYRVKVRANQQNGDYDFYIRPAGYKVIKDILIKSEESI